MTFSPFLTLTSFRSGYIFSSCQGRLFSRKPNYLYKAGRQQWINFGFTIVPSLFHCNLNDGIKSKTITKSKEKTFYCHYRCNQAGTKEDIPAGKWKFNWSIWIWRALANSRQNNTNKSYVNYFIKWQKCANQSPQVNAVPAYEIHVILSMLNLFQNNDIKLSECRIFQLNIFMNFLQEAKNQEFISLLRF